MIDPRGLEYSFRMTRRLFLLLRYESLFTTWTKLRFSSSAAISIPTTTATLRIWRFMPEPPQASRQARRRAPGRVGDAQQQSQQRVVGEQRRAAVGEERRGQAGLGQQAGDPGNHHEQLKSDRERQPGGQQLAERVAHRQRRCE